MTRIRRERKTVAQIPATQPIACPVEALGREFKIITDLENLMPVSDGPTRIEERRDSLAEAGAAIKTRSALGALFQLALASDALATLEGYVPERDRRGEREVVRLRSWAETTASPPI